MATLSELIKGFRENTRSGFPTTLVYGGCKEIGGDGVIRLNSEAGEGYVGLCLKPTVHEDARRRFTYRQYLQRESERARIAH